jgi:hypothetical protein
MDFGAPSAFSANRAADVPDTPHGINVPSGQSEASVGARSELNYVFAQIKIPNMKPRIWLFFAVFISLFGAYALGYYKGARDTTMRYSSSKEGYDPYFAKINRIPAGFK